MSRDAKFDNIKALLIFLVVLGHSIEYLYGVKGIYGTVRAVIYSFHMPAFVFISGFFAEKSKSSKQSAVIKYIVTYMLFNTLFAISPWSVNSPTNFLFPQLIYWYLICLCFWRISIDTISKIRFIIPISVLFTLYIGTCPMADRFMSISRAICFYTFFLVGYKFSMKFMNRLKKWMLWPLLAMGIAAIVIADVKGIIPVKMYEYIQSYEATGVGNTQGVYMRIFMMTVAFVLTICLIGIIPSKRNIFTVFGEKSLSIYLLHIFVIKFIGDLKIADFGNAMINAFFAIALSMGICTILALPVFSDVYNRVMKIVVSKMAVYDAAPEVQK